MLYSAEKGNNSSFRGRVWRLPNRYWRACNYSGQQCTYKLYNEALTFSQKGKPVNEGLKRQQTRYRPELSKSEMERLVKNLKDQGYKAIAKGPNLKTDATDKAIDMAEGVVEGELQPGKRVPLRKPLKDMPDRKVGQDEGINEGPQPHGLVGGKRVTTIRDINHKKSGKVIPKGTTLEMKFSQTNPGVGYVEYEGHWMITQLQLSHKSFRGIGKPPSMKQLQNMDNAGIAKSVTGKRVDLDGHGPDGAPSWLLAMGLI